MPSKKLDRLDSPLPCYRDKQVIAVGSADIFFPNTDGVTVRAATAGNLTYVTLNGTTLTETLTAGADIVGPGNGLVAVREIKGSSTVTSVIVGVF